MTIQTTTLTDTRRWQLKRLISNMIDEEFEYWYKEIMTWRYEPTAEQLVEDIKKKSLIKRRFKQDEKIQS